MKTFETMGREELLRALSMFAKNWLAHDGCWFLAAEERFGIDTAIELDARSWARFAAAEARRVMATFGIPAGGGLPALSARDGGKSGQGKGSLPGFPHPLERRRPRPRHPDLPASQGGIRQAAVKKL